MCRKLRRPQGHLTCVITRSVRPVRKVQNTRTQSVRAYFSPQGCKRMYFCHSGRRPLSGCGSLDPATIPYPCSLETEVGGTQFSYRLLWRSCSFWAVLSLFVFLSFFSPRVICCMGAFYGTRCQTEDFYLTREWSSCLLEFFFILHHS